MKSGADSGFTPFMTLATMTVSIVFMAASSSGCSPDFSRDVFAPSIASLIYSGDLGGSECLSVFSYK